MVLPRYLMGPKCITQNRLNAAYQVTHRRKPLECCHEATRACPPARARACTPSASGAGRVCHVCVCACVYVCVHMYLCVCARARVCACLHGCFLWSQLPVSTCSMTYPYADTTCTRRAATTTLNPEP